MLCWINPYAKDTDPELGEEGTDDNTSHKVASQVIEYLARYRYERACIYVCEKLGHKVSEKRMPAYIACAIWDESNTAFKPQRVILRYL